MIYLCGCQRNAISAMGIYEFSTATVSDAERIMEIIEQAKRQMRREGRNQWDETYPALEDIMSDIESGNGYVLSSEGCVIAYGAVIFTGEPTYSSIKGKWLSEQPYVVLHRLAVADGMKGRGIAGRFMKEVWQMGVSRGVFSFKVDTNFDNLPMLKVLDRLGFSYCGDITLPHGRGSRMAYEKLLD